MSTQADSKIGELAFYDSFSGAVISAAAAIDTNVSVDDVGLVALCNSLNGAVIGAGAALNASISNLVSHDFPSNVCIVICSYVGSVSLF